MVWERSIGRSTRTARVATVLAAWAFTISAAPANGAASADTDGRHFASGMFSLKRPFGPPSPLATPGATPQLSASPLSSPIGFEVDRVDDHRPARFTARARGFSLSLTRRGATLALHGGETPALSAAAPPPDPSVVRLRFVGAARPALVPERPVPGTFNEAIGADRSRWRARVPTFGRVRYRRLWPGVDALFYGARGHLEYDFVLAPGADPGSIRFRFEGEGRPRIDDAGDLVLDLPGGEVRQMRPIAYQLANHSRRFVPSRYVIGSDGVVRMRVGSYDRARPLIIDPVLTYSTFFAPGPQQEGSDVATDAEGNVYITGLCSCGPLNSSNVYVAKFNAAGDELQYTTILGGVGMDEGHGVAVDPNGSAYITGRTNSSDFPTTGGAPQSQVAGGWDAFVTKLDPAGSVSYSTLLGAAGDEAGEAIAVDAAGQAHIAGSTSSAAFATTENALDRTLSGPSDAFIARLDEAGEAVLFSTLLGGGASDGAAGIAIGPAGSLHVAGSTSSHDFPISAGAAQTSAGGGGDAWVARLDAAGSALSYSTYLGGSGSDDGAAIATDSAGAAFVAGGTTSADFPVGDGLQPGFGGVSDAFVAKLDVSGASLEYATYLGGSGSDFATGIAVSGVGEAHVSGETSSSNFPTVNAIQSIRAGQSDAFVARLNSTFLGGSTLEGAAGIALDADVAYVVGSTRSADFPIANAYQPTFVPGVDAFLSKLDGTDATPPQTSLVSGPPPDSASNSASFAFSSSEPASRFECRLDGGGFTACTSPQVITALSQGVHTFRVRAIDAANNVDASPASYVWNVDATPPDTTIDSGPPVITNMTTAVFAFSGGATFECKLDAGAFVACASPQTYMALAEGTHALAVRATDAAGNTDVSPATYGWTIDRVAPDTFIDSGPISPSTDTSAVLVFSASSANSTFECRLDAAPYVACASPRSFAALTDGSHTFRVRATDPAGNTDASEATHVWTIETAAPETTIVSGPPRLTSSPTATFEFAANEPATFACSHDGQPFEACASPVSYLGQTQGEHSFEVRARDLSGKVDASPASWPWTVDLSAPAPPALVSPPDVAKNLPSSPGFTWSPTGDDGSGVSHYELRIDGVAVQQLSGLLCGPALCSVSPIVALVDGPHTWQVRAVDLAGNESTTATRSFTVDAAPPSPFVHITPAEDAATASRRPRLAWQSAVDEGIGVAGYDVVLDGEVVAAGLSATATEFAPADDLAEGPHHWQVVARDGHGNERASPQRRFVVDVTPPNAAFTAAPNPVLAGRVVTFDAAGSTDAVSGLARFEWDLDSDGTFERDTGATPSTSLSYPEPGTFGVQLRVTDRAGLTATTRIDQRVSSDSRTSRQLGVSINDRARYTRTPRVVLRPTWPAFANQMLISNDGGFDPHATRALARTISWTLDSSGAERSSRIVYVRFARGLAVSETYTDDIILDESRPSVTSARLIPATPAKPSALRLRARDRGLAGVSRVQVTNDRRNPRATFRASRTRVTLTHRRGDRRLNLRKTLFVRVRDRAGNLSAWRTVTRTRRSRGA
jgi:hypothetical protein